MGRKQKIEDALELARELFRKGRYAISSHAKLRQKQRSITTADIENVVMRGRREKRKDEYKEEFDDWNYAFRGKTLDNDEARIGIAFNERKSAIVVTVIRLGEDK